MLMSCCRLRVASSIPAPGVRRLPGVCLPIIHILALGVHVSLVAIAIRMARAHVVFFARFIAFHGRQALLIEKAGFMFFQSFAVRDLGILSVNYFAHLVILKTGYLAGKINLSMTWSVSKAKRWYLRSDMPTIHFSMFPIHVVRPIRQPHFGRHRHARAIRYPFPAVLVNARGLRVLVRAHPEDVGALDFFQPLLDRVVRGVRLDQIASPILALLLRLIPILEATAAIDGAEPYAVCE